MRCPIALVVLSLVAISLGCGGGGRIFRARKLPNQYIPPPVTSVQTLDLARFTRPSLPNNQVQSGDLLNVTVITGMEKEQVKPWQIRVSENGAANLPLIGVINVAGLDVTAAEQVIYQESIRRGLFRNPQISVVLKERRSHRVTVVGAVRNQGTFQIPAANSDVIRAIMAAGGFAKDADTIVEIRQEGYPPPTNGVQQVSYQSGTTRQVNLAAPDAHLKFDLRLQDGATVHVQRKPKRSVYVIGLVNKVDQYEMPNDRDMRMLDALAMAGGRTLQLADQIKIIRRVPGMAEPLVIEASVRDAKSNGAANVLLAPGDVVSVEETPLTFAIDTLRSFIRFGFTGAVPGL